MIEQITIRRATRIDTEKIAQLWVDTFPDKFGPILGSKAQSIIYDWLRLSEHHIHTTIVAEISGEVGGFMSLKSLSNAKLDNGDRWFWHALQLHQNVWQAAWSFIKMSLIDSHRPVQNDEMHIEMLGVAQSWRGHGLAGQLIQQAESIAKSESLKKLTLNVVCDNATAIKVYHKFGFEVQHRQQSPSLAFLTGYREYYEMVKYI